MEPVMTTSGLIRGYEHLEKKLQMLGGNVAKISADE